MAKLYSKFENLDEEKKKRIIDICIEEFAKNGYKNASTNSIVKKAGISKGILFHYFGNKKNLFLYILDYTLDYSIKEFYKTADSLPVDIFDRIMYSGLLKIKMATKYPSMYKVIIDAFTHIPDDLQVEMQNRYNNLYKQNMPFIFKDIDTSKFRKGIDKEKAIELISFALQGVSSKLQNNYKDKPADRMLLEMENLVKEYSQYIDILKLWAYDNG